MSLPKPFPQGGIGLGTGTGSDCVFADGSARAIEAQAKPYTQEAISHILTRHEVMFTWWLG